MSSDDGMKCNNLEKAPHQIHKSRKEQSRFPLAVACGCCFCCWLLIIKTSTVKSLIGRGGGREKCCSLPPAHWNCKKRNAISQVSMKAQTAAGSVLPHLGQTKTSPHTHKLTTRNVLIFVQVKKDEVLAWASQNGNTLREEKTHTRW
jgi:hypothetical protein